jgi:[acyl-carrier-protein] S-malonyltransferase
VIRQLPSPVLWEKSVKELSALGADTFIEVGPGTVLTGLIKRIIPEANIFNVHDPKSLETTVAGLKEL